MYPVSFQSAQRTIRVWTIGIGALLVVALAFAGTTALAGHGGGGSAQTYVVSYSITNESMSGPSGSAPMRVVTEVPVAIAGSNLTAVTFSISWQDQTLSPLTDPVVTATVTGPNGTGTATGRVMSGGTDFTIMVPNELPENQTVKASSEAEALALASEGLNATLGSGEWTVALDVGSPLGGIVRPGAAIAYTISLQLDYFVGSAERV